MDNYMKLIYMVASLYFGLITLCTAFINSNYAIPKAITAAVIFYFSARLFAYLACKYVDKDLQ